MGPRTYYFETLDVYRTAMQFSRVLGASGAGMLRTRRMKQLIRACVILGTCIAGGNAQVPPEQLLTREDRESFLSLARNQAERLRIGLEKMRRDGVGSPAHILAGLELLERLQGQLEDNLALIRSGFVPPCPTLED